MSSIPYARERPSRVPSPALLGLLVAAALSLAGCEFIDQLRNPESYAADARVRAILTSMQQGTHLAQAEIVCLWGKGSRNACDTNELEIFYDKLTRWTQAKDIYRGIKSWEIVESVQDPSAIDPIFFFHLKINDKNAYWKVWHQGGIDWATKKDMPTGSGES